MNNLKNIFASRKGIIIVGAIIGVLATLLQKFGNPANMGICVACFTRDIAGALGFHRAAVVQYLRPEILAIVIGALLSAIFFKEFRPRTGSAPIVKLFLGIFAMIGALVFLGCTWRLNLRLAAGDGSALFGLLGLVAGIWLGTRFFAMGYNPGRAVKSKKSVGWAFPLFVVGLLILMIVFPYVEGQSNNGVLAYSIKGPGRMHAPVWISIVFGLVIGVLLQRSRFCTIGGFRDFILFKQTHLMFGVLAFFISALLMNIILGQFKPGMINQPIAHNLMLWNFLGMLLSGLAFTLAGGCPGRQLVLSGEGDGDASLFVIGMLIGAGFAHNFMLAASPKGVGINGKIAVIVGLVVVSAIALGMREKE